MIRTKLRYPKEVLVWLSRSKYCHLKLVQFLFLSSKIGPVFIFAIRNWSGPKFVMKLVRSLFLLSEIRPALNFCHLKLVQPLFFLYETGMVIIFNIWIWASPYFCHQKLVQPLFLPSKIVPALNLLWNWSGPYFHYLKSDQP